MLRIKSEMWSVVEVNRELRSTSVVNSRLVSDEGSVDDT